MTKNQNKLKKDFKNEKKIILEESKKWKTNKNEKYTKILKL